MLAIESIDVGSQSLRARVRVSSGAYRTSASPGFAERALELLPGLVRHSCENGTSRGIAAELRDTETAHALEHIAFELMALSGSPRSLHGETRWDFAREGAGIFDVELEYDDDLVALGALKAGAAITEWLLVPRGLEPDVSAAVERLERVRRKVDG